MNFSPGNPSSSKCESSVSYFDYCENCYIHCDDEQNILQPVFHMSQLMNNYTLLMIGSFVNLESVR